MGSLEIAWNDTLATGHRATDVQHKYLIDIINELAVAIESGRAASKVGEILNLLEHYTEWHFSREEMCMEKHRCPAAAVNKQAHGWFLERLGAFRRDYRASGGSETIAREMYRELTEWLVSHIQKVDGKLAPCVHSGEATEALSAPAG